MSDHFNDDSDHFNLFSRHNWHNSPNVNMEQKPEAFTLHTEDIAVTWNLDGSLKDVRFPKLQDKIAAHGMGVLL